MKRILLTFSSVITGASIAWCYPLYPCPPAGSTCSCGQNALVSTTNWCCESINGCTLWAVNKWSCNACPGLPATFASYLSSINNDHSPGCVGATGLCM